MSAASASPRAALRARIAAVLDTIPEPCAIAMGARHSLASMGLVETIAVADDGDVAITLCLTDPACVHFRSMQRYIADAVGALDGVRRVSVDQVLDRIWTPDRAISR